METYVIPRMLGSRLEEGGHATPRVTYQSKLGNVSSPTSYNAVSPSEKHFSFRSDMLMDTPRSFDSPRRRHTEHNSEEISSFKRFSLRFFGGFADNSYYEVPSRQRYSRTFRNSHFSRQSYPHVGAWQLFLAIFQWAFWSGLFRQFRSLPLWKLWKIITFLVVVGIVTLCLEKSWLLMLTGKKAAPYLTRSNVVQVLDELQYGGRHALLSQLNDLRSEVLRKHTQTLELIQNIETRSTKMDEYMERLYTDMDAGFTTQFNKIVHLMKELDRFAGQSTMFIEESREQFITQESDLATLRGLVGELIAEFKFIDTGKLERRNRLGKDIDFTPVEIAILALRKEMGPVHEQIGTIAGGVLLLEEKYQKLARELGGEVKLGGKQVGEATISSSRSSLPSSPHHPPDDETFRKYTEECVSQVNKRMELIDQMKTDLEEKWFEDINRHSQMIQEDLYEKLNDYLNDGTNGMREYLTGLVFDRFEEAKKALKEQLEGGLRTFIEKSLGGQNVETVGMIEEAVASLESRLMWGSGGLEGGGNGVVGGLGSRSIKGGGNVDVGMLLAEITANGGEVDSLLGELMKVFKANLSRLDTQVNDLTKYIWMDGTGMIDWALESLGASIIHSQTSVPLNTDECEAVHGILKPMGKPPEVLLQPNVHPGQCFSFAGPTGKVTIMLPVTLHLRSFTLEHIHPSINNYRKSAPKQVKVYGIPDPKWPHQFEVPRDEYEAKVYYAHMNTNTTQSDAKKGNQLFNLWNLPKALSSVEYPTEYLGEFNFNPDLVMQTFTTMRPSRPIKRISFAFTENFGGPYTCVYRIRVHGEKVPRKRGFAQD